MDMGRRQSHFQFLSAMGANGGVAFIALAAIKAKTQWGRGKGFSARRLHSLFFLSGSQVKREEDDQDGKNADGPKEAAGYGIPPLLGVVKNPHGNG